MKLFAEDIALEVMKTLITSDQRELIQLAEKKKIKTTDAVALVSFDFAESFLTEAGKRNV